MALDFDALAPQAAAPAPGQEWPVDAPRHEALHWLRIDIPAHLCELAEGQDGYDGPQPAANDALVHHLVFALYALSVECLALVGPCTAAQVRQAMAEHVLGSATYSGTYTLNRRWLGQPE
jgi:phosphatidylethanolamine-binding protein (PEBP) family uncharacterized protein